jgi:hypothetical protein
MSVQRTLIRMMMGWLLVSEILACRPIQSSPEMEVLSSYPNQNPTTIKSVFSQKLMTIRNKGARVGDQIEQRSPSGVKEQQWKFIPQGGDFYSIASTISGMCLEIYMLPDVDKADIGQMPCNGNAKQKWQVLPSPEGATLKNGWNYMCVSLTEAKKDDGLLITLDNCVNQPHQLWQWEGYSSGAPVTTGGNSVSESKQILTTNTVIGIHAVTPGYQFTNMDPEVEVIRRAYELGSHIVKVDPHRKEGFKAALELPFSHYFLWFRSSRQWVTGMTPSFRDEEYKATYHFAKQLLGDPALAGKSFFFGHWEGDWYLLGEGNGDGNAEPTEVGIAGMVEWLNIRQKAVDDAKKEFPQSQVKVYTYAEVNRVRDWMTRKKKRMVNTVLPKIDVDYISYSAYDVQQERQEVINATLDYIQSQLRPRPQIPGKRVFIGEFGMPLQGKTLDDQNRLNKQFIAKFAAWGTPFMIYWSMYETKRNMTPYHKLAVIDENNSKTPFYYTLQEFYRAEGQWLKNQGSKSGDDQSAIQFVKEYFSKN